MNEYKDISELLESDKRAMAFYNSLPMSTQRRLHRTGVRNLKALYECASSPTGSASADNSAGAMNTASANEATGSVPAASDLSRGGWDSARRLQQ